MLNLGDALVIPAFAGWRAARAPQERGGIRLAPDWVCDVASPESEALDRIVRPATYRAADIPWVWLVDPGRRTVEVFAGDGPWWRIAASGIGRGLKRLPPFEGLALDPLSWFQR